MKKWDKLVKKRDESYATRCVDCIDSLITLTLKYF